MAGSLQRGPGGNGQGQEGALPGQALDGARNVDDPPTWLLELAKEQRQDTQAQLEHHHHQLRSALEARIQLLEARLRVVVNAPTVTVEDMGSSGLDDEDKLLADWRSGAKEPEGAQRDLVPEPGCVSEALAATQGPVLGPRASHSQRASPVSSLGPMVVGSRRQLQRCNSDDTYGSSTEALNAEQPEQGGFRWFLRKIKKPFSTLMGFLIILNAVVVFTQLQLEGYLADAELGLRDFNGDYSALLEALVFFEQVLNGLFIAELLVRIVVWGRSFLTPMNLTDAVIVILTTVDMYILTNLASLGGNFHISFLRVLRFCRIVRALRVIRTMRLFRHLRILLSTIASSVMSLVWSMIILVFFQVCSAMFLCQMLHDFITDETQDHEMRLWVNRMFGTSTKAWYTMFEVTFSGGWPNYARPVIEEVSNLYVIFFVAYITGVNFAMIRIISALFLKETLRNAENDADMMIQEKLVQTRALGQKLRELFKEADISGDGNLSLTELRRLLRFPKVRAWLEGMGVNVRESKAVFELLDDGDGQISYEEFVKAILRLKGFARSQDIVSFHHATQKILETCEDLHQTCSDIAGKLGGHSPWQDPGAVPGDHHGAQQALLPPLQPNCEIKRSSASEGKGQMGDGLENHAGNGQGSNQGTVPANHHGPQLALPPPLQPKSAMEKSIGSEGKGQMGDGLESHACNGQDSNQGTNNSERPRGTVKTTLSV